MKRRIFGLVFFMVLVFVLTSLGGCFFASDDENISIVCTMFPQYDWVKNVLGETEGYSVSVLMDKGVDLHNYQPTAEDLILLKKCDYFIYVGGESDEWVEDALSGQSTNPDMVQINLLQVLGDKALVAEHDHDHEEGDHGDHDHQHHSHYDEHVWLSVKNANIFVDFIAEKLIQKDDKNAMVFEQNALAYCEKLTALDQRYQHAVANANVNTVLIADRFPFVYLFEDYSINYHAAFSGCSTESEASLQTIVSLAQQVDALGLNYVIVMDTATNNDIANAVIANTTTKTQTVLVLNSMQSINVDNLTTGEDYFAIMTQNLAVLTRALNN